MRVSPPTVRRRLLAWYDRYRRDLPWRREPDLYHTLVAEFMLQQTRVEQALPYYERFLRAFPTLQRLARAPLAAVVKLWEGLGYYHRAKHLHAAARVLSARARPALADLDACPGIGPYTRAAIGSIVFGAALPVVDGNVNRVVARVLGLSVPPRSAAGQARVLAWQEEHLDRSAPGDWNQAVMELGARVCTPKAPRCGECPLAPGCRARAAGRPEAFPLRAPKRRKPHRQIAAAIIRRRDGRVLIAQRPPTGLLSNLWEFPGGKRERGESLASCCAREVREELGVHVAVGREVARVAHAYSHFSITLHVFECRYVRGKPRTWGCQAWRWVRAGELRRYPFPGANRPILARLTGRA